jgi:methylthioribose-1-phosphate isomerase
MSQGKEIRKLPEWNVPLTIWWDEERKMVKLIDQTLLPDEVKVIECDTWKHLKEAISVLKIRGAPALGAAGAYALALEAQRFEGDEEGFFRKMDEVGQITKVRPTAANLKWAVDRVVGALREYKGSGTETLKKVALEEAEKIIKEDVEANKKIGENGLEVLKWSEPKDKRTYRILTHCHAGSLATCGYGTVFGS